MILKHKRNGVKRFHLTKPKFALVCAGATLGVAALCALTFQIGTMQGRESVMSREAFADWEQMLTDQHAAVQDARSQVEREFTAVSQRLAEVEAQSMRLNALGERLIVVAGLDPEEFDFSEMPALGGPLDELGEIATENLSVVRHFDRLADQISGRLSELEVLGDVLRKRFHKKETTILGRPVKTGWISSPYGVRRDPFTGRRAWHSGIDFAAKSGTEVQALAGGVVTAAKSRNGYGHMVEINHGDGLSTRYGHNKKLLVQVGEVVKRGQAIALVGSTGRSTGPHVHLEVRQDGKAIDPTPFVRGR